MAHTTMRLLAIALLLVAASPAFGGTVRYDLPGLLGQHSSDEVSDVFSWPTQQIDTPFGFGQVDEARLVIVGTVSPGLAHGNGITHEAISFQLLPVIHVIPSFADPIDIYPSSESFHFETVFSNPFFPNTTPLPGPDGHPPVSFSLQLIPNVSMHTSLPPHIPGNITLEPPYYVDVPIIAHIQEAYILLGGPQIVPEPRTLTLTGLMVLVGVGIARRTRVGC